MRDAKDIKIDALREEIQSLKETNGRLMALVTLKDDLLAAAEDSIIQRATEWERDRTEYLDEIERLKEELCGHEDNDAFDYI